MNLKKYLWKNRLLLIETCNYTNKEYKNTKKLYNDNIKEFHKRYIKIIVNRNKSNKFNIKLIGFDGSVKTKFTELNVNKIFKLVDKMPIAKLLEKYKNLKPKNLSLYSDYNDKKSMKGLGFKNKDKALYTICAIKDKPLKYQVNVISTMLGRAKNHPHINDNMRKAIKVFETWLDKYKINKQNTFCHN